MIETFGRVCCASASEGLDHISFASSFGRFEKWWSGASPGVSFDADLSPSPWWGGVRGGGTPCASWFDLIHYLSAIPPTPSLPHQGGGDDLVAALGLPRSGCSRAPHETLGPGSRAGVGAACSNHHLGPRWPGMTSEVGAPVHIFQFASPDGACERTEPGPSHLAVTLGRLVFLGGRSVRSPAGKIPDDFASRRSRGARLRRDGRDRVASGNAGGGLIFSNRASLPQHLSGAWRRRGCPCPSA
jgi:hypothetical protein